MTESDFEQLRQTMANRWNEGDAPQAAECFSEDAVYMEPPDKQHYRGRNELYEFFAKRQEPRVEIGVREENNEKVFFVKDKW